MHALYHMNPSLYHEAVEHLVSDASKQYHRTCYISFNDPFNVVINFLERVEANPLKFVVVDASNQFNQRATINRTTYTIPTHDLFRTYLLLRSLIMDERVEMLLLDSLSALIRKCSSFPLKRMVSDLLLEVGTYRCNTAAIVFDQHSDHEVVESLRPLIGKNVRF